VPAATAMPLAEFDQWHYVLCRRIFLDTEDRQLAQSPSPFNARYELDQLYEKVVGIELATWNLPLDAVPGLYEASTAQHPRNNVLDVYLEDIPFTTRLAFTVALVGTGFANADALGAALAHQLLRTMDDLSNANWNSGTSPVTTFRHEVDGAGRLLLFCERDQVANSVIMQFLFATGPNAGASPWSILGFADAADTQVSVSPLLTYPVPSVAPRLSLYRYVDVTVDKTPEFAPLRRILMVGDDYHTHSVVRRNFMLLTRPLRTLDSLRVRVTLSDGTEPTVNSSSGMDFVLDLLVVAQEQRVPPWVQQVLRV
jgi:hypothetical protein